MPGPSSANQLSGLGARLRAARKVACLTQDALAHQAGMSAQLISMLERGKVLDPHVSSAVALSHILGVTTDYLLVGVDSAEEPACKAD